MSAATGTERSFGAGAGGAAGKLGQEFERAKDNISGAAASAKDNLSDDFSNLRDDMAKLSDTVTSWPGRSPRRLARWREPAPSAAKEQVASMATEVENIVRRNPLGTLAGVFLAGLRYRDAEEPLMLGVLARLMQLDVGRRLRGCRA